VDPSRRRRNLRPPRRRRRTRTPPRGQTAPPAARRAGGRYIGLHLRRGRRLGRLLKRVVKGGGTTAPTTTAAPKLDVISVTIDASGPLSSGCSMVASVTVQSNGAADGTLTLSWFTSSSATAVGTVVATDPVSLPKGQTQVSAGTPTPSPPRNAPPTWVSRARPARPPTPGTVPS
jgi:hypothetical protein